MKAFGVANHSVDSTINWLKSNQIIKSDKEVQYIPVGTNPKIKKLVVFILNISDLFRNIKKLNTYQCRDILVFIFASPIRLNELDNCTHLDFVPHETLPGFRYVDFKNSLLKRLEKPGNKIRKNTNDYLQTLSDRIKSGSLLTPLMTYIYSLPNSTHQTPVKLAVAKYLYGGTYKDLEATLNKIPSSTTLNVLPSLQKLLKSEISENFRLAFKELHKGVKSVEAICKKYDISPYEIRYIRSLVEDRAKKVTK